MQAPTKDLCPSRVRGSHPRAEPVPSRYVVTTVPPVLRDELERWVFEEMQTRTHGPWHVAGMGREEFRQDCGRRFARLDAASEGLDVLLESRASRTSASSGAFPRSSRWASAFRRSSCVFVPWAQRIQFMGT